jgi:hypothetical protein
MKMLEIITCSHSCGSRNPVSPVLLFWIPAFAGMTNFFIGDRYEAFSFPFSPPSSYTKSDFGFFV